VARRSKKQLALDLEGQPDPAAPLDWQQLLSAAGPVMAQLKDDLRARAKASPAVTLALKTRHAAERADKRTADSFVAWQDHFIEQVAAAWMLSCVFVRTLEDRGLLGHNRLAGPGASDSLRLFLDLAPSLNERDYLLTIFKELTRFPATRDLFDARHNPVWLLTPSAEGAKALVQLFQRPRADEPAFRFGQADTGFLGWIYQDLDADVRARFALLQTPRFIESFILDRTLEPAIAKFGLDDTTLIDPTCGSGHFLLGAFDRLVEHRLRKSPGLSPREAARLALDAIYGADVNPYAVAIARFRLTLAFFDKAGFQRLSEAPAPPLHVVVADSLLHNPHLQQGHFGDLAPSAREWKGEQFALEDEAEARKVLYRRFSAVVGNPPYITVKDRALREEYRAMYPRSAGGQYSIAAPFTERFFQLARQGGRVGMITANSFMKREFGKKLIEQYLPSVNLDLVINTSGAYIPGHGTPTVLLFGSSEPAQGTEVDTVLASRGEPSTPEDPEQGLVWRSIAGHWSEPGFENEYITVAKTARDMLAKHPWSLGGGGAGDLKELLEERAAHTLGEMALSIGRVAHTGNDEAYVAPYQALRRQGLRPDQIATFVEGQVLRDWSLGDATSTVFPYDEHGQELCRDTMSDPRIKWLWPFRTMLWGRREPNGDHREIGKTWYEFSRFHPERYLGPGIAFAFVATHNHFVLDRGGKVFNRSAPIIKLPATATDDDHLALLAYLNSSTACFWMKQVFYPKATTNSDISIEKGKPEDNRYEFAGTGLQALPLPSLDAASRSKLVDLARHVSALAETREGFSPDWFVRDVASGQPRFASLAPLDAERQRLLAAAMDVQEAIDWLMYAAFGLAAETSEATIRAEAQSRREEATSPPLRLRASARETAEVRFLEDPMYKRPWAGRRGVFGHAAGELVDQVRTAARGWVEERAEEWLAQRLATATASDLARAVPADALQRIADATGIVSQDAFVRDAVHGSQAVPFLAALRLTDAGLARHAEWLRTWDLQRREDAGENVGTIPVPPKYAQKDYRSTTDWQLRGPLDVPKERFISYPGCESDHDGEAVYGWAGWDHEQRARALATLYWNRKTEESWSGERLTPMLAGLLELLPWLGQWHAEPSDDYAGDTPANYYTGFLDAECRAFGLTHDDLRAWRPPEKTRGRKNKAKKLKVADDGARTRSPRTKN
jgi:hypothetical protein